MTTIEQPRPSFGLGSRSRSSRPSTLNPFDFGCAVVQTVLVALPMAIGVEAELAMVWESWYPGAWAKLPGFSYARAFGPLVLFGVTLFALLRRKRLPDPTRRTLTPIDRAFLQGAILVGAAAAAGGVLWLHSFGVFALPALLGVAVLASVRLWRDAGGLARRAGPSLAGFFVGALLGAVVAGVVHSILVYVADADLVLQRAAGPRAAVSGLLTGALLGTWLSLMAAFDREAFEGALGRRFRRKRGSKRGQQDR